MSGDTPGDRLIAAFSRLRQVGRAQIGRVLGTVARTNGRYKTWIDLLERSYFVRADTNALATLLIQRGVFTIEEWNEMRIHAAIDLANECAKDWPELEFAPDGRSFAIIDAAKLAERARAEEWPP